ncbi:MAG TPA: hypothetical protein VFZ27_17545 [Terriglobia bacterium]|nr:hypothetical protein [Terriglobia bacterium]
MEKIIARCLEKDPAKRYQSSRELKTDLEALKLQLISDSSFSVPAFRLLFQMLGTPPSEKRHIVLDTPNDVTARRAELVNDVLAWLDKYPGRVN